MAKSKSNGKASYGVNKSLATAVPKQPAGAGLENEDRNRPVKTRGELKESLQSDPTADYHYTRNNFFGELFVQNLPLWRLLTGRMMLASDPVVSFSMNIRNAALMAAEVDIQGRRPEIVKWVRKQWEYLWCYHRMSMLASKELGFAPLQPLWKADEQGILNIVGLKEFAPEDCRGSEKGGKLVGFKVKGEPLFFPQGLWINFDPKYGGAYGRALTRRQYPAWYEKWMERGAKRLQQLRMIKDAYIGDIFWYPPDLLLEIPDGNGGKKTIPWRDVLREIAECRMSGGAMTLPLKLDANGKELTRYQPPTAIPGSTEIFNWVEYCDENIFRGGDIPFEVVQAADTGSGFSGRSIPFLVLLSVCNGELTQTVQQTDERSLRGVASLNFGGDPDYTMKPKSLVETFSANIQGSSLAGSSIGGPIGQQQPGQQGVPQAVAQQYAEEKTPEPPHEFSCLLFNLPGDLGFQVRQLGDMIPEEDLALDGREKNPHVTIKFGLHTNDPEEVRQAIQDLKPVAIQIGKASIFQGKGEEGKPAYDVLKLEVESSSLHDLNNNVSQRLECTDTHPEYKPHITIAYVKPGLGEYYANKLNTLEGETAVFNKAIFSDKQRNWHPIKLLGQAQFHEPTTPTEEEGDDDEEEGEGDQFAEGNYLSRLREMIGRGLEAAKNRVGGVARYVRSLDPLRSFQDLAQTIEEQIRKLNPLLGNDLFIDAFPSHVEGSLDVLNRLPDQEASTDVEVPKTLPAVSGEVLANLPTLTAPVAPPPVPPALADILFPEPHEPEVHLPAIEAAVETLKKSPVAVGSNYLETAQKVKQGSFAITGDLTDKAVSDVRDVLTKTIAEGKPQQEFIDTVAKRLEEEGSPLSPPHLENVFRTNTMSAYSKAQAEAVQNPLVGDAFPYVMYSATKDARVRPEHWALESHGLNETNIYRYDDPTFQKFRPPWSYNCRCRWTPQTVEQAARRGVEEAKEWLDRAKSIAKAQGGSFYQYLAQSAPVQSQHVTPPDFEPDPAFKRDLV
jgi:SPP1 gp7 family putative phage head morphogenesis protein